MAEEPAYQLLVKEWREISPGKDVPAYAILVQEWRAGKASATPPDPTAPSPTVSKAEAEPQYTQRRNRVQGKPPTCRASKWSKEPEIRKVYEDAADGAASLTTSRLQSYLCDFLGFGVAESLALCRRASFIGGAEGSDVPFDGLKGLYPLLNPYCIEDRRSEVIYRKQGPSIPGKQAILANLEDCEVYICDRQDMADMSELKRCLVLIGPTEGPVQLHNCEDCIFWVACQQFRTRDCKRCTIHLYCKTEPIIETSDDLIVAPFTARYPHCDTQFAAAGFDPSRNFWNAIFDFNGEVSRAHWRIPSVEELTELAVCLDDPPAISAVASNPTPAVTQELLCAAPLVSGDSCGASVLAIPQTRPPLPASPRAGSKARVLVANDGSSDGGAVGLTRAQQVLGLGKA